MPTSFWTTRQLFAAGHSADDLTDAVRAGSLIRARRGIYARPDAPPELIRAVRVGGPATATTAAPHHGLWTPPDGRLHVHVPAHATRLRDPDDRGRARTQRDDLCVHWGSRITPQPRSRIETAPVLVVLEHALECLCAEYALAMIDSALHERRIRPADLVVLQAALPLHLRRLVARADGRAESGIESIARARLGQHQLRVEVQVDIAGIGRVDLLVEGRLIIELDGRTFHDDPSAFARDRSRDAAAAAAHYRTLRFTYAQVLFDWPAVESAIFGALAA